ncbi:outer membrane beta-barrel protein [Moritella viscosa]|uniref:Outer membrane protein n=1 Tax=Moritella viscosa TaxID=80854 RepID=A0ABY1HM57_9GAMM|nr:outer membrane beta-barrel protein [Moritella viscosa]SGZ01035.1 Putative outer membrane protein [Moritella viscosa]SGZ09317.1 Putative outer membrane protein [Moritella viscosa]
MFKKVILLALFSFSFSIFASEHQINLGLGGATLEGKDDDDIGFAANINYAYQFHPYLSLELGRMESEGVFTSIFSNMEESIEYSATYLGVKAHYYPVSFFNVYALGGANYSEVEKSKKVKSTGATITSSNDGINAYFGAGAEFVFFNNVGLGLEYRTFFLSKDYKSNAVLANLSFKF